MLLLVSALLSLAVSAGYGTGAVVRVTLLCSGLASCHFRPPKRGGVGLLILGLLLAAIVLPRLFPQRTMPSLYARARGQGLLFEEALEHYKQDNGLYPTTAQGLKALVRQPTMGPLPCCWREGGYLNTTDVPRDPWGTPYIYLAPGQHGAEYDLKSLGADHREGGEGDAADLESRRVP